ncbi:MAG: cell division protein FtsW [Firmicutes bacterium]|nr:cell division protein FtsW [Bacillota bacterium]
MRASIASLNYRSVDFPFLLITLILVAFGLVMVFSASYYSSISMNDTPFYYLIRDGIWVFGGLVLMCAGICIDYRVYKKIAPYLMLFIVLSLVAVLLVGITINGAKRWLGVGPVTFMPGEWTKPALILFIAWFMGERPGRARSFFLGVLPVLLITGLCAFLIIRQPNLSTAITVCGIAVAMLLVAGMRWLYVWITAALGVGGLASIILYMQDSFWYTRMTNFIDPFKDMYGEGYQVAQSLLALGSGGLTGLGLGKSVQKSLYLPEPQNDFILAIIGEELGFIGIMGLVALYCLFIWRGIHIALNAPDQYGLLLASGVVIMVAIQVILNIAVVTASMPATGINLPFISYGGNGTIIFMFSAGVLLNISRQKPEPGGITL